MNAAAILAELRDELVELVIVKCCDPLVHDGLRMEETYAVRATALTAVEYTIAALYQRGLLADAD